MRFARQILSLTVALATLVAGCSMVTDDNANGGLVNTSWTVATIDGAATLADGRPTLVFAPDGLSGTTGCNSYGGTFRTDGDAITISVDVMTEMACDGPRGAQEVTFIAALPTVTSWVQREDGALQLDGGASIVAMPAEVVVLPAVDDPNQPVTDGDLPGTTWELIDIDGSADLAGVVPTLEFAVAGTAAGSGGCNRFSGPYTLDGPALAFGALASTKMACGDPADAVEQRYLGILQGVATWTLDPDGSLRLAGPAGSLHFAPG